MWETLTGAGGLVVAEGRLLMIRQRRHYGTHWELPSGYHEPGESLEEATVREVLEETSVAVDIGELVCTLTWAREHDCRRNVLAFFAATPTDASPTPKPQVEEDIDEAAFVDPLALPAEDIHPLNRAILDRWWPDRTSGFHLHADISVRDDGTQDYRFR